MEEQEKEEAKKEKGWIAKHKVGLYLAVIVILGIYYFYLVDVSKAYAINGMWCISDTASSIVLDFDGDDISNPTLSMYGLMDTENTYIKVDYAVGYRRYQKGFLGGFWSHDGIEFLPFNGYRLAGKMSGKVKCITIITDEYQISMSGDELEEYAEETGTELELTSRFYIKNGNLCLLSLGDELYLPVEDLSGSASAKIRALDNISQ